MASSILGAFSQASINGVPVNPWGITADALAIAPYFAGSVADDITADGVVDSITIDEVLDRMEATLPTAIAWTQSNKVVADAHGVALIAYEGGQHLVATGDNRYDDTLTEKLIAANRDQRMYGFYRQYMDGWFNTTDGLFTHYCYVKESRNYGSWGALEHLDQPRAEAPKYRALLDLIASFVD